MSCCESHLPSDLRKAARSVVSGASASGAAGGVSEESGPPAVLGGIIGPALVPIMPGGSAWGGMPGAGIAFAGITPGANMPGGMAAGGCIADGMAVGGMATEGKAVGAMGIAIGPASEAAGTPCPGNTAGNAMGAAPGGIPAGGNAA